MNFVDLPTDIQKMILKEYMEPQDALRISKTCKKFYIWFTQLERLYLDAKVNLSILNRRRKAVRHFLTIYRSMMQECHQCHELILKSQFKIHLFRKCRYPDSMESSERSKWVRCNVCEIALVKKINIKRHQLYTCRAVKHHPIKTIKCHLCGRGCPRNLIYEFSNHPHCPRCQLRGAQTEFDNILAKQKKTNKSQYVSHDTIDTIATVLVIAIITFLLSQIVDLVHSFVA